MSAPHGTVEQIEEKEKTHLAADSPAAQPVKKNRIGFFASAIKSLLKWKDALNPKYVYGQKKAEARQQRLEDGPSIVPSRYVAGKTTSGPAAASTAALSKDASRARASSARSGSRTQSDRPSSSAGVHASGHHGRKGRLLFKPLPPIPPLPPKSHA